MAREATADHCSILRATRHIMAGSLFNVDLASAVRRFTGWHAQRHGARPNTEAAETLVGFQKSVWACDLQAIGSHA